MKNKPTNHYRAGAFSRMRHLPACRLLSVATLLMVNFANAQGVTITVPGFGKMFGTAQTFLVHGVPRTCESIVTLDKAFETHNDAYFDSWTDQDYDNAVAWASACANYGPPVWRGQMRISFLREHQQRVREDEQRKARAATAQHLQAENAEARQKEAEARQKEAERISAQQKEEEEQQELIHQRQIKSAQLMAKCRAGNAYKLYEAQESIIADQESKSKWERVLAREKKVEEISGAENPSLRYSAGNAIVDAEERMTHAFGVYKSSGGTAPSPQAVTHEIKNPCPSKGSADSQ